MRTRPVNTLHLEPGMRVAIGRKPIVRTVGRVVPNGAITPSGPSYTVWYQGPVPPDGWGEGNSGTRTSVWSVITDDRDGAPDA